MINSIVTWLTQLIESTGYIGVGLSMFIESFFAPIPSELILPFAGFVASKTDQILIVSIIVASISAYLGSLPFYFLGVWGKDWVNRFLNKWGKFLFIYPEDVEKGFKVFDKYGSSIIFFGRLVPMIRTVISFPAGVAKTPFIKFTIYTLLGSTIWSSILAISGYYLGENWEIVSLWLSKYEEVVLVSIILIFVGYIIYKLLKHKSSKSNISN
jgi:membrane protein DedA with SNARE-associated domain